jgi:hypothetical protein
MDTSSQPKLQHITPQEVIGVDRKRSPKIIVSLVAFFIIAGAAALIGTMYQEQEVAKQASIRELAEQQRINKEWADNIAEVRKQVTENPPPSVNGVPYWANDFGEPTSPKIATFTSGQLTIDIHQVTQYDPEHPEYGILFEAVMTNTSDELLTLNRVLISTSLKNPNVSGGSYAKSSPNTPTFPSSLANTKEVTPENFKIAPGERIFDSYLLLAEPNDVLNFSESHTPLGQYGEKPKYTYSKIENGKVTVQ